MFETAVKRRAAVAPSGDNVGKLTFDKKGSGPELSPIGHCRDLRTLTDLVMRLPSRCSKSELAFLLSRLIDVRALCGYTERNASRRKGEQRRRKFEAMCTTRVGD